MLNVLKEVFLDDGGSDDDQTQPKLRNQLSSWKKWIPSSSAHPARTGSHVYMIGDAGSAEEALQANNRKIARPSGTVRRSPEPSGTSSSRNRHSGEERRSSQEKPGVALEGSSNGKPSVSPQLHGSGGTSSSDHSSRTRSTSPDKSDRDHRATSLSASLPPSGTSSSGSPQRGEVTEDEKKRNLIRALDGWHGVFTMCVDHLAKSLGRGSAFLDTTGTRYPDYQFERGSTLKYRSMQVSIPD